MIRYSVQFVPCFGDEVENLKVMKEKSVEKRGDGKFFNKIRVVLISRSHTAVKVGLIDVIQTTSPSVDEDWSHGPLAYIPQCIIIHA